MKEEKALITKKINNEEEFVQFTNFLKNHNEANNIKRIIIEFKEQNLVGLELDLGGLMNLEELSLFKVKLENLSFRNNYGLKKLIIEESKIKSDPFSNFKPERNSLETIEIKNNEWELENGVNFLKLEEFSKFYCLETLIIDNSKIKGDVSSLKLLKGKSLRHLEINNEKDITGNLSIFVDEENNLEITTENSSCCFADEISEEEQIRRLKIALENFPKGASKIYEAYQERINELEDDIILLENTSKDAIEEAKNSIQETETITLMQFNINNLETENKKIKAQLLSLEDKYNKELSKKVSSIDEIKSVENSNNWDKFYKGWIFFFLLICTILLALENIYLIFRKKGGDDLKEKQFQKKA